MRRMLEIVLGVAACEWRGEGEGPQPVLPRYMVDVTTRPGAWVGDLYNQVADAFTRPEKVPPAKPYDIETALEAVAADLAAIKKSLGTK